MSADSRVPGARTAGPVFARTPKGPRSLHDFEYDVTLDGAPVGRVYRRRHTGVGGPGARWAREVWGHDCWAGEAMVEGRLRWSDMCKGTRLEAAREIAREALGLSYRDRDPF